MSCESLRKVLKEYLEGLLPPEKSSELDDHTRECAPCAKLIEKCHALAAEMTCQDFTAFLDAYLEDDLPTQQLQVFQRHLDNCPECDSYLDGYRKCVELGRTVCGCPDAPIPAEAPEDLIKAILDARRREGS